MWSTEISIPFLSSLMRCTYYFARKCWLFWDINNITKYRPYYFFWGGVGGAEPLLAKTFTKQQLTWSTNELKKSGMVVSSLYVTFFFKVRLRDLDDHFQSTLLNKVFVILILTNPILILILICTLIYNRSTRCVVTRSTWSLKRKKMKHLNKKV